jgi:hypothetical protein
MQEERRLTVTQHKRRAMLCCRGAWRSCFMPACEGLFCGGAAPLAPHGSAAYALNCPTSCPCPTKPRARSTLLRPALPLPQPLHSKQVTPSASYGWLTTLQLWPLTGRKHQLRRHCAHVRVPAATA